MELKNRCAVPLFLLALVAPAMAFPHPPASSKSVKINSVISHDLTDVPHASAAPDDHLQADDTPAPYATADEVAAVGEPVRKEAKGLKEPRSFFRFHAEAKRKGLDRYIHDAIRQLTDKFDLHFPADFPMPGHPHHHHHEMGFHPHPFNRQSPRPHHPPPPPPPPPPPGPPPPHHHHHHPHPLPPPPPHHPMPFPHPPMHDPPNKDHLPPHHHQHHIPFKPHRPSFDHPSPFPSGIIPSLPPPLFPMPPFPSPFPSGFPNNQGAGVSPQPPKNSTDFWEIVLPWWYPAHSRPPTSSTPRPKPSQEVEKPNNPGEASTGEGESESPDDESGFTDPTTQPPQLFEEETTTVEPSNESANGEDQSTLPVEEEQTLVGPPGGADTGDIQAAEEHPFAANEENEVGENGETDMASTTEPPSVTVSEGEDFVSTSLVGESETGGKEPPSEVDSQGNEHNVIGAEEEANATEVTGGGEQEIIEQSPDANQGQDEEFVSASMLPDAEAGDTGSVAVNNEEKDGEIEGQIIIGGEDELDAVTTEPAVTTESSAISSGLDEDFVSSLLVSGTEGNAEEVPGGGENEEPLKTPPSISLSLHFSLKKEPSLFISPTSDVQESITPIEPVADDSPLTLTKDKQPEVVVTSSVDRIDGLFPQSADDTTEQPADNTTEQNPDDTTEQPAESSSSVGKDIHSQMEALVKLFSYLAGEGGVIKIIEQDDSDQSQQAVLPPTESTPEQSPQGDFMESEILQSGFPDQVSEIDQSQAPIIPGKDTSLDEDGANDDKKEEIPGLPSDANPGSNAEKNPGKVEGESVIKPNESENNLGNRINLEGNDESKVPTQSGPTDDENSISFSSPSFFDLAKEKLDSSEKDKIDKIDEDLRILLTDSSESDEDDKVVPSMFSATSFFENGIRRKAEDSSEESEESEESDEDVSSLVITRIKPSSPVPDPTAPPPSPESAPSLVENASDDVVAPAVASSTPVPDPAAVKAMQEEIAAAVRRMETDSFDPIIEFLDPSTSISKIIDENGVLK